MCSLPPQRTTVSSSHLERAAPPPNKGMKQTSVEHIGRSQLIPGVGRTFGGAMRHAVVVLLAGLTATGSSAARAGQMPTTREVKRRVAVSGGPTSVTHRVYVTNRSSNRLVQTVVLGLYPGLREQPKQCSGPAGWWSRVYQQPARTDGIAWAVEFSCLRATEAQLQTQGLAPESGPSAGTAACGIGVNKTAAFDVVLVHLSPTLEVGPIGVVFSDGEAAMTVE
jgi:hypothetical protein